MAQMMEQQAILFRQLSQQRVDSDPETNDDDPEQMESNSTDSEPDELEIARLAKRIKLLKKRKEWKEAEERQTTSIKKEKTDDYAPGPSALELEKIYQDLLRKNGMSSETRQGEETDELEEDTKDDDTVVEVVKPRRREWDSDSGAFGRPRNPVTTSLSSLLFIANADLAMRRLCSTRHKVLWPLAAGNQLRWLSSKEMQMLALQTSRCLEKSRVQSSEDPGGQDARPCCFAC